MAITTINIGTEVNDGTGDAIRSAFDKVNTDFLYLDASNTFNNKLVNSNIFGGTSTLTVNEVNTDVITANVLNTNALTVTDILTVANTTQSTDIYTGAIVTTGGLGVAQTAYIGGDVHVLGTVYGTFVGPTSAGDINGTRIGTTNPKDAVFSNVRITDTTTALSSITGALRVTGGVAAGNIWVGGNATVANLTVTSTVRGSLYLTGSDTVYINGAAVQTTSTSFPGGNVQFQANFNATTSSTDPGTGAVIIKGGLGVQGNINVGGFVSGGNLNLNTAAGHLELGNVDLYANGAIFGNILTGPQPGITSVGSLNGLTVAGNIVAGLSNQYYVGDAVAPFLRMYASRLYGDLYGVVQTPAQTSITSLGILTGLNVQGTALLGDVSSNVVVVGTSISGNVSTGALVVRGGLGVAGNLHAGAVKVGQITYSDNNILTAYQSSVNTYNQMVLQNSNTGTSASADYVVNNDQSTATSYYGDFGINSSNFSGSGSLAQPNTVYLTATTGDLVLGTTTANAVKIVVDSGTTDAVLIDTNGNVVISSTTNSTSADTGALIVAGGASIGGNLYLNGIGDISNALTSVYNNLSGNVVIQIDYQNYANANALSQAISITNIQANLGAYQQYANANIGTLFNGNISTNANLGAYQQYANANIVSYQIFANANVSSLQNQITGANTNIQSTSANLGAYQTWANATVSATQANLGVTQIWANANIATINANLGSFQTYSNANIAAIRANIGSFYNYANTKIGTNTNSNIVVVSTADSTSNVTGALVVGGGIGMAGNLVTSGWILPTSNVAQNIGSSTAWWNTVYGRSVQAQYADLAEIYSSDQEYKPGTVVIIGGVDEVTVTTQDHDPRVAGVVSTDPAYLMNSGTPGLPIALTGRVPCLVQGPVTKGALLVTSRTPGVAQAMDLQKYQPGCVIGKSLCSISNNDTHLIEIMVGRF